MFSARGAGIENNDADAGSDDYNDDDDQGVTCLC